mgnify:CR=1 FL=1
MDLFKVSLSCSLIGVFIILLMAETFDLSVIKIKEINDRMLERNVKVIGEVDSVYESNNMLIININDGTGKIKVVIFEKGEFNLSKGDFVEVKGEVVEYKGELEINANSVEIK